MTVQDKMMADGDAVDTGVEGQMDIAKGLAEALADTYKVMIKTHIYHWNVEGPLFYSVHNLTEGQYEDLFAAADDIAERIRALGVLAPLSSKGVLDGSVVTEAQPEDAIAMCQELADDHEAIAKRMKDLIAAAGDQNDPVTEDLITARSAFHEKAAWMLRAITK